MWISCSGCRITLAYPKAATLQFIV
ncbi:hypothetical protein FKR84_05985 [Haloflavibacter putidus]|uniref:Zinc finger LSD1-type domain-containing protein n=1 Tax=Haloflavibacter putidus TaxID=2576776 RepID=A0A507ZP13_9FLAO|nr:hypothetical protein FKR84_05985 [Haloflavibacter putidus]